MDARLKYYVYTVGTNSFDFYHFRKNTVHPKPEVRPSSGYSAFLEYSVLVEGL